jgi:hypothetical protein
MPQPSPDKSKPVEPTQQQSTGKASNPEDIQRERADPRTQSSQTPSGGDVKDLHLKKT